MRPYERLSEWMSKRVNNIERICELDDDRQPTHNYMTSATHRTSNKKEHTMLKLPHTHVQQVFWLSEYVASNKLSVFLVHWLKPMLILIFIAFVSVCLRFCCASSSALHWPYVVHTLRCKCVCMCGSICMYWEPNHN